MALNQSTIDTIKHKLLTEYYHYDIIPSDASHLIECWNDANLDPRSCLASEPLVLSESETKQLIPLINNDPEFQKLFTSSQRYWNDWQEDYNYVYGRD
jgi:hypothetical protein